MNKRKRKQLMAFFNKKLEEWAEKKEEEHWYLKMKLTNLINKQVSFGSNAFWERVVNRILIKAEEMGVPSKQIVEYLFDQENSEEWMLRFQ